MSITFSCPRCHKEYSVPDEFAGRGTTCRECKGILVVPNVQIQPAVVKHRPHSSPQIDKPVRRRRYDEGDDDEEYEDRPQRRRLADCPGCGSGVSPNAVSCPRCGYVLRAQVVEQTGKQWKALQLFGGLGVAVGTVMLCSGLATAGNKGWKQQEPAFDIGCGIAIVGIVVFLIGKIGGWWHHG